MRSAARPIVRSPSKGNAALAAPRHAHRLPPPLGRPRLGLVPGVSGSVFHNSRHIPPSRPGRGPLQSLHGPSPEPDRGSGSRVGAPNGRRSPPRGRRPACHWRAHVSATLAPLPVMSENESSSRTAAAAILIVCLAFLRSRSGWSPPRPARPTSTSPMRWRPPPRRRPPSGTTVRPEPALPRQGDAVVGLYGFHIYRSQGWGDAHPAPRRRRRRHKSNDCLIFLREWVRDTIMQPTMERPQ